MKNKGFTMVELLAVLVILSIILLIVIPSVLKSYENSRQTLYDVMEDNICSATKNYFEEYQSGIITYETPICTTVSDKTTCNVSISELQLKKYISNDIENPLTGEKINTTNTSISIESTNEVDSNGNTIYKYYVTIDENRKLCDI